MFRQGKLEPVVGWNVFVLILSLFSLEGQLALAGGEAVRAEERQH